MEKRVLAFFSAVAEGGGDNGEAKPENQRSTPVPNTPALDFTKKYSSDELRQLAVDYMREQLSIKWHPNATVTDYKLSTSTNKFGNMVTDQNHAGLRYSWRGAGSLYNFLNYYDPATEEFDMRGLMKDMGINPDAELTEAEKEAATTVITNHCSGSAFWALSHVASGLSYTLTRDMLPYNGCIALVTAQVGTDAYNYLNGNVPLSIAQWKEMVQGIGEEEIFAGYEKLKPGDGLTNPTHTIIAIANDTVNQEITFLEQVSTQLEPHTDGYTYQSASACKESKITYAKLFAANYLPYTIDVFQNPALINTAERQPALTTNQFTSAMTVSQVMDASVDSNYPISYVRVDVLDKDGKAVKTLYGYTAAFGTLSNQAFNLGDTSELDGMTNQARAHQSAAIRASLEGFADGNHTLNVSAQISTGHTLTVMNGITLNAG